MLMNLILISIWACPSTEAVGSGCPFQSFWKGTQKGFSLASLTLASCLAMTVTQALSNPINCHTNQQTQLLYRVVDFLTLAQF